MIFHSSIPSGTAQSTRNTAVELFPTQKKKATPNSNATTPTLPPTSSSSSNSTTNSKPSLPKKIAPLIAAHYLDLCSHEQSENIPGFSCLFEWKKGQANSRRSGSLVSTTGASSSSQTQTQIPPAAGTTKKVNVPWDNNILIPLLIPVNNCLIIIKTSSKQQEKLIEKISLGFLPSNAMTPSSSSSSNGFGSSMQLPQLRWVKLKTMEPMLMQKSKFSQSDESMHRFIIEITESSVPPPKLVSYLKCDFIATQAVEEVLILQYEVRLLEMAAIIPEAKRKWLQENAKAKKSQF